MSFSDSAWLCFGIAFSIVVMFLVARNVIEYAWPLIKSGFVQSYVMKNGIPVNADIIATQQTTVWSGGKPVFKIFLKFRTIENKEFEASILLPLTVEEIERFKPGNGTTIKYDAKNPQRIALYDKPLILE